MIFSFEFAFCKNGPHLCSESVRIFTLDIDILYHFMILIKEKIEGQMFLVVENNLLFQKNLYITLVTPNLMVESVQYCWRGIFLLNSSSVFSDSSLYMASHPRLHSMSVWLHLIPKLHTAGANNIFPAHNAFTGHDDPSLFTGVVRPSSFSHGYQVSKE